MIDEDGFVVRGDIKSWVLRWESHKSSKNWAKKPFFSNATKRILSWRLGNLGQKAFENIIFFI